MKKSYQTMVSNLIRIALDVDDFFGREFVEESGYVKFCKKNSKIELVYGLENSILMVKFPNGNVSFKKIGKILF